MRAYININTGEKWTEGEIRTAYYSMRELQEMYPTFDEYMERLLDLGRQGIDGVIPEDEKGLTSKEIRDLLGVSRAEFSRRYGIPVRTLENWDAGVRVPPEWVLNLLERVVRFDVETER